jgi:hypothetical protein
MHPRRRHLDELRGHIEFLKVWYGRGWERRLNELGAAGRGEVFNVLARRCCFSRLLLPRLRALRRQLEWSSPSRCIAKPPPSRRLIQRRMVNESQQ